MELEPEPELEPKLSRDKAIKYFKLARSVADLLSEDPSRKVGTVILCPRTLRILSVGYNGFPDGVDASIGDRWTKPMKYDFCVHAEINGVCNAARSGTALDGSIAVVTLHPCCGCCQAFIQAGVKLVVTLAPDLDDPTWGQQFRTSGAMMREAGIRTMLLAPDDVVCA